MKFHKSINKVSQLDKVATYLLEGNSFTTKEAKRAGIVNPTSVVCLLRQAGLPVVTTYKSLKSGATQAVYSL